MPYPAEQDDWPECQPPAPPTTCRSCGEPFTDDRPFITAFGNSRLPWCPECADLWERLDGARYDHDVYWPHNYALSALELDEAGQRRAASLYASLGWCDPGG